jgi:enoyl-CoA hydratase/carnithine racemase
LCAWRAVFAQYALVVAPPRVVILAGAGGSFVSGADIKDFQGLGDPVEGREMSARMHRALARFAALPCPSIAALDGAVFNQPEVALGILPGGSGTARLPRLIGRSRALEVILGCDDIDAATAERWGWVNRALPAAEVRPFAQRLARRIAGFPPHAVAAAKASVLRAEKDVVPDLLAEAYAFNQTLSAEATRHALQAFLDRGGQTVEGESRLGDLATELG